MAVADDSLADVSLTFALLSDASAAVADFAAAVSDALALVSDVFAAVSLAFAAFSLALALASDFAAACWLDSAFATSTLISQDSLAPSVFLDATLFDDGRHFPSLSI